MRTIVIKNNTNTPQHIRGLRASDGGQETTFHVMPRARATLKADTFFDLDKLPKDVTLVSDSAASAVDSDYAARKAAANAPAKAAPASALVKASGDSQQEAPKGNQSKADNK